MDDPPRRHHGSGHRNLQTRIRRTASPHDVYAAPETVLVCRRDKLGCVAVNMAPNTIRLWRINWRPKHSAPVNPLVTKGVPDHLCTHPHSCPGVQLVHGSFCKCLLETTDDADRRGLSRSACECVSSTNHSTSSTASQSSRPGCQPRPVFRNPPAPTRCPAPNDAHQRFTATSRHQRIFWCDQPLGQAQPVARQTIIE